MIILNLEVINGYRSFQDFMLNLFNNGIFAIDKNKNVTGTEMDSFRPALDRRVEGVCRCSNDLFTASKDMNQFVCLIHISLNDFFDCNFSGIFVPARSSTWTVAMAAARTVIPAS